MDKFPWSCVYRFRIAVVTRRLSRARSHQNKYLLSTRMGLIHRSVHTPFSPPLCQVLVCHRPTPNSAIPDPESQRQRSRLALAQTLAQSTRREVVPAVCRPYQPLSTQSQEGVLVKRMWMRGGSCLKPYCQVFELDLRRCNGTVTVTFPMRTYLVTVTCYAGFSRRT